MAKYEWANVAAPNFSSTAQLQAVAMDTLNRGTEQIGDVFTNIKEQPLIDEMNALKLQEAKLGVEALKLASEQSKPEYMMQGLAAIDQEPDILKKMAIADQYGLKGVSNALTAQYEQSLKPSEVGTSSVNLGDRVAVISDKTGLPIYELPIGAKPVAATAKDIKAQQDADKGLVQSYYALGDSMGIVDDLLKRDNALSESTGWQSVFPTVAGSEVADWESKLDTLQSQAFLNQIDQMRGLGQLTEREGALLKSSISSLSLSQSDKQMKSSLNTIKNTFNRARENTSASLRAKGLLDSEGNIIRADGSTGYGSVSVGPRPRVKTWE